MAGCVEAGLDCTVRDGIARWVLLPMRQASYNAGVRCLYLAC